MRRAPLIRAPLAGYPDLVRSPWALGLMTAGGLALASVGIAGCQCLPTGEKEPVQEPVPLGGVAPRIDPVPPSTPPGTPPENIPEVPPEVQGTAPGDPTPEVPTRTAGEPVEPAAPASPVAPIPPEPQPHVRGDMPAPEPPQPAAQ
jgi:hypothetical protein